MKALKINLLFGVLLGLGGCLNLRQVELPPTAPLAGAAWDETEVQALSGFRQLSLSDQLNNLIATALTNNYNLQATAAKLEAAHLAARASAGGRLPEIGVSVSNQTQETADIKIDTASALLNLSWELDVWGRLAAQANVAQESYLEQAELYAAARYSLAAQVAKQWFDVIAAKQQLQLTEQRVESLAQSYKIIADGFESGIRTAFELYTAKAEIASNRADLAEAQRNFDTRLRNLSVLLGQAYAPMSVPEDLPDFNTDVPDSLASELILRRSDMLAASHRVAAQFAQTGVAFANRLPRFSLTASSGAASDKLSDVLSGSETTWSLLGGLTMPLFQGGALAREQQRQQHLFDASVLDYQQTALTAYSEIEQTLANEQWYNAQVSAAATAVDISEQAEAQALEQYIGGISNLNTWLQAQRTSFSRKSGLLQNKAALLKNRIDLYLALGGDFDGEKL